MSGWLEVLVCSLKGSRMQEIGKADECECGKEL